MPPKKIYTGKYKELFSKPASEFTEDDYKLFEEATRRGKPLMTFERLDGVVEDSTSEEHGTNKPFLVELNDGTYHVDSPINLALSIVKVQQEGDERSKNRKLSSELIDYLLSFTEGVVRPGQFPNRSVPGETHQKRLNDFLKTSDHVITTKTVSDMLLHAIKYNYTDCAKQILVEHNTFVDVNWKGGFLNFSLLYWAARNNNEELLDWLLIKGADVNIKIIHGVTPLIVAADYGSATCLKKLLASSDIDVNTIIDRKGVKRTALCLAAKNGHAECVKALVDDTRTDVNKKDEHHYSPLHLAAFSGHTECVKHLLAHPKIDVNREDCLLISAARSPLHTAAEQGKSDCVELLLQHPDIIADLQDPLGDTPLILAEKKNESDDGAKKQGKAKCALLIQEYLDNLLKPSSGFTPR